MTALRTTFGMVLEARQAVLRADEFVEAAAGLLAEAVDAENRIESQECLRVYRQAKAHRVLAGAVCDGVEVDWYRDQAVSA